MLQKILLSNFLGQNKQGSGSLNQLMEKADSLPRLMEEDSFLSEFKSGSGRICEYMTYDRFIELTEYITVVGDETDRKRAFKFPQTACELLTSDNTKIEDYFLPINGHVSFEEKITKSIEKEVEQEVEVEDEDEQPAEPVTEPANQQQPGEDKPVQGETGAQTEESEAVAVTEKSGTGARAAEKGEDEQFGDFVEAPPKKKKTVMVKEVVDIIETVKHEKPAMINKLLEYFSQPINYTLTGYVSKVLLNLLNRRTQAFLSKLFDKPSQSSKIFENIFSHLGSRSTVDLLSRIFTIESKSYLEERQQLLVKLIEYLKKTDEIDSLSNITACVIEVFDKTALHLKNANPVKELDLYNAKIPDLLSTLVDLFLGKSPTASNYSVPVICHLLVIFNIKDESEQLQAFLSQYLQGVTQTLQSYLADGRKHLGVAAVRLVESLNSCLRSWRVNECLAKDTQLYPTLLALARKYSLNNIFHNEVFRLLTSSLSSPFPELTQNVFDSANLAGWLESQAKDEQARRKSEKPAFKRGYAGHLYHLCRFLKQNAEQHTAIAQLLEDERFAFTVSVLLEDEDTNEEKMLGGLAKKETVHAVLYSKESVLQAHAKFLSATPSPVLEQDMEDPSMNPILLEELQRQLNGVEIENEALTEEVVEECKHKVEMIEENEHHKSAFWKVHLDYDLEGLMEGLMEGLT